MNQGTDQQLPFRMSFDVGPPRKEKPFEFAHRQSDVSTCFSRGEWLDVQQQFITSFEQFLPVVIALGHTARILPFRGHDIVDVESIPMAKQVEKEFQIAGNHHHVVFRLLSNQIKTGHQGCRRKEWRFQFVHESEFKITTVWFGVKVWNSLNA
jgi:hypothetical protein